MSWAIGYDDDWARDIGYGVPAYCDHPKCSAEIDRGLAHVCGGEPYGGDDGCGLYFCGKHLFFSASDREGPLCRRCLAYKPPYKHPKPEHPDWIRHKLTDPSWEAWRKKYPKEVAALKSGSSFKGKT